MEANAPCKRLFAAGQEEIIVELGIIARPEGIRGGNGVLDVGRSFQLTDDSLRMREERRTKNADKICVIVVSKATGTERRRGRDKYRNKG